MKYFETDKKPSTNFLLDAVLRANQSLDEDITQVNIHSRPTNRLNQEFEPSQENAFTYFDLGSVIAGYKLVHLMQSSRRTEVFYAEELGSKREAVIKQFSEREQECYKREKAIQKVLKDSGGHKNLLLADEFLDEQRVVISPYARGGDLRDLQKRDGKLTPRQTIIIVSGLCDALDYLHERGIVHRDVKSRNVVLHIDDPALKKNTAQELELSREITPKLFDYELGLHESVADLAVPGIVIGTPSYIAPEAWMEEKCDLRLDIYALGITLFELLAGDHPFIGNHRVQIFQQHLSAPVPDITRYNPEVTKGLQCVIEKALAKNPDERYQSAGELKQDYLEAAH